MLKISYLKADFRRCQQKTFYWNFLLSSFENSSNIHTDLPSTEIIELGSVLFFLMIILIKDYFYCT